MKRIFVIFLFIIPISLFAQTKGNPTLDKVKAGVKKYLYLTMKDYSSYKPVQWGKLENNYFTYYNTDRAKKLIDSAKSIKIEYEGYFDAEKERGNVPNVDLKTDSTFLSYKKLLDPVRKSILDILATVAKEKASYKNRLIGYTIYHSYRGKNSYGAYSLGSDIFTLSTTFKVIGTASDEEEDDDSK
jgi:hypothetical protein